MTYRETAAAAGWSASLAGVWTCLWRGGPLPPLPRGSCLGVLFVLERGVRLERTGGSALRPEAREVLLLTADGWAELESGKNARGLAAAVDRRGGPWPPFSPDLDRAQAMVEARGGGALLQGDAWTEALFSALHGLPAERWGEYGAFKAVELLYLLTAHPAGLSLRNPAGEGYIDPYQVQAVRRAHAYMLSHLEDRLTIQQLSRTFGLSPTLLKSGFRQLYGEPVHRYLRHRRLERAAELLAQSEDSILQVAAAVGYGSASQFGAAFKGRYHMPPSDYRRRARNKMSERED